MLHIQPFGVVIVQYRQTEGTWTEEQSGIDLDENIFVLNRSENHRNKNWKLNVVIELFVTENVKSYISFLLYPCSVLVTPLDGSVPQVKKQSESQSSPRRCLPLLQMFEQGDMARWLYSS